VKYVNKALNATSGIVGNMLTDPLERPKLDVVEWVRSHVIAASSKEL